MVAAGSMHCRTGGASSSRLIHAHPPHTSHRTGTRSMSPGSQVVLGERLPPRDGGVLAVEAVAPPVERAGEPVLARPSALRRPCTPRWRQAFWNAAHPHVVGAQHDDRLIEELVLDEVARLRDLLEPARHLPDPRPQQLDLHLVEVGVEVALLGNPVRELRVHRVGHRECRPLPIHDRHVGNGIRTGRYNSPRHGTPRTRSRRRRAGRRRRHHRHLPAVPRSRSRLLRAAARGRRRRRRHLVLEPLPRGAVRLGELHVRATCSRRSCSTSGSGRSTSPNNRRPSATSTTWSTGSTSGATSDSAPRSRRPCTTSRRGRGPSCSSDGTEFRAQFLIAATGVLSVPYFPDVPGRDETFAASRTTPGCWPATPVDFAGKRVAVIGTGSSGVQLIPAIAGEVASLTVYQRTANWCTPLNNAPITPEEQAQLRADFEAIRETLNTSVSGFLHPRTIAPPSTTRRRSGGRSSRRCGTAPASRSSPATTPTCCSIRGERRVVRVHRREDPQHRRGSRDRARS